MAAKKKRKRSLPPGARSGVGGVAVGRSQSAPPQRAFRDGPDIVWVLTLAAAAALMAAVGVAYDGRLFAPYFLSGMLPLLPLALGLALLALARVRPGTRAFRCDALDLAALAFGGWQVLSALLSPTFVVAFFGYYNRGEGAVFWIALALIFVASRRLLSDARSHKPLVWIIGAVLILAGAVAVAQALGATGLWGGVAGRDRLTGTTGNPISLGGLGLLAVWLGVGLSRWRRFSATWLVAAAGTLAGIAAVVLSVSRAAMAALVVCGIVLAVVWLRRRRRSAVVVVAVMAGVVVLIAAAYAAGPGTSLLSRIRGAPSGGLNSSDDKRVELWGEALRGLKAYPLAGTGPGAFVVVDRLYRPAARRVGNPWALASDPHSLPLSVAAGSGVVGLLAGGLVCALLGVRLWRRARSESGSDEDDADSGARAADRGVGAADSAGPALVYVLAAAIFSLVSPVEAIVLVPAALLGGAACGVPYEDERWSWRLAVPRRRTIGRAVYGGLVAVCAVALVLSVVTGVQWYRADRSFAAFARGAPASEAVRAAGLWRWEPFYALEAGSRVWRSGLQDSDAAELTRGRALVERGVALDPTGPLGYADLARLELSRGNAAAAVEHLRRGLRWNPSHPVLQGLWGYSALMTQTSLKDPAEARRLLSALQALPVDTPDGWYWISRTLAARGDASGAVSAREGANKLAPRLGSWRYRQRLLQAR